MPNVHPTGRLTRPLVGAPDLKAISKNDRGSGSTFYHPQVLRRLLRVGNPESGLPPAQITRMITDLIRRDTGPE
jgi:hypothetical protein